MTLALPLATFTTMVMGAYVKAVYGGLACPEWPTCMNGQVIVELSNVQVASEVLHRAAALVVSIAGFALLFLCLTQFRGERRLLMLTLAAGATLAVQVSLGALTIFTFLEAAVVTSHLAVATVLFALTIFIAQEARRVLARLQGPPGDAPAASGASQAAN